MALYDPQELARMFAENPKSVELTNEFEEGTVEWQRKNLTNLMNFLWSLPDDYKKFNMNDWMLNDDDDETVDIIKEQGPKGMVGNLCGTAACAAGHAAVLGIGNPEVFEDWSDYCAYAFGEKTEKGTLWDSFWNDSFPTPKHAALRIAYCLKYRHANINSFIMEEIANKTLETV